jgi:hypothetical protein
VSRRTDLPPAFLGRTDEEDVERDVEGVRNTTMADRARILESLCRMAAEQIAHRHDPQRVLDWRDPISEESEKLLARLRNRRDRRPDRA